MSVQKKVKRVTTHVLSEMKLKGEKISMLTAYDFSMAQIIDNAGIDVILVGDSASNVMAGNETTCSFWRAFPPTGAYETIRLAMAPAICRITISCPLVASIAMVVLSFSVEDLGR